MPISAWYGCFLRRAGHNTPTGGSGADFFWFETNNGIDVVTDYSDGVDKIVLGSSIATITLYY